MGSRIFFSANDVLKGRELFVTDGTSLGTHRTADLNIGGDGSNPEGLVAYGSQVVLSATRAGEGREPWISDGTEAGTRPISDIAPGSADSNPRGFTVFKGAVYFQASTATYGSEVWVTRGTQGTTALFKDTNAGNLDGEPGDFNVVGPVMLFSAYDLSVGAELWTSDGTTPARSCSRTSTPVPGTARSRGWRESSATRRSWWPTTVSTGRSCGPTRRRPPRKTKGYAKTVAKSTDSKKKIYVKVKVTATGTVPTGKVTLKHGSTVLGHKTLSGGKAWVRVTKKLGTGTHYLRAYYSGSATAKSSKSQVFKVKVEDELRSYPVPRSATGVSTSGLGTATGSRFDPREETMPSVERTVTTDQPLTKVWEYLSDFTHHRGVGPADGHHHPDVGRRRRRDDVPQRLEAAGLRAGGRLRRHEVRRGEDLPARRRRRLDQAARHDHLRGDRHRDVGDLPRGVQPRGCREAGRRR